MKSIGEHSANDQIQKILSTCIDDDVLCQYSYTGRKKNERGEKNKKFSDLIVNSCIFSESPH